MRLSPPFPQLSFSSSICLLVSLGLLSLASSNEILLQRNQSFNFSIFSKLNQVQLYLKSIITSLNYLLTVRFFHVIFRLSSDNSIKGTSAGPSIQPSSITTNIILQPTEFLKLLNAMTPISSVEFGLKLKWNLLGCKKDIFYSGIKSIISK